MDDTVTVGITFEVTHPTHGVYRDQLFYSLDEYLSDDIEARIEADKEERFGNWVANIENPSIPEPELEPTPTQLMAEAATALADIAQRMASISQPQPVPEEEPSVKLGSVENDGTQAPT